MDWMLDDIMELLFIFLDIIIVLFLSNFMPKYLMVRCHDVCNFLLNSMAKHSVCVCVLREQDYK